MSPGCSSGPEFRFGEGRISGVSSLALGALSLLAVLCFRFPELLTTPDLRAVYPLPRVRAVLLGAMLLSLALPSATAPTSRSAAVAGSGTTSKRLCTAAESPGLSSKVMGFGGSAHQ